MYADQQADAWKKRYKIGTYFSGITNCINYQLIRIWKSYDTLSYPRLLAVLAID
jgi:hypothetical protein